jgi:hypothetical protein
MAGLHCCVGTQYFHSSVAVVCARRTSGRCTDTWNTAVYDVRSG